MPWRSTPGTGSRCTPSISGTRTTSCSAARADRRSPPRAGAVSPGGASELLGAGVELRPCRLEFSGDLPAEAGLSSSAALSISLCLALCAVAGAEAPERVALARLCSRIENVWCGAETGLLDQLASLCGEEGHAVRIDMDGPKLSQVPLELGGHALATIESCASRRLPERGTTGRD